MSRNVKMDTMFLSADVASVNDTTPFALGAVGKRYQPKDVSAPSDSLTSYTGLGAPISYRYVKRAAADTGTTLANGRVVYWQDMGDGVVTGDISEAMAATGPVAGVALGAYPEAGKYGFIQVRGVAPVQVATGSSAVVGDLVYSDADVATYHASFLATTTDIGDTVSLIQGIQRVGWVINVSGTSTEELTLVLLDIVAEQVIE